MTENNKVKKGFWITGKLDEEIDSYLALDDCDSRSEFVEKAVQFYIGYLNTKNADAFLPQAVSAVLIGTMDYYAQRIGVQLYKLAVEQNLCNHILACDTDMDQRTYELMRGRSVREVKATNGGITFKDALDFQKTV